MGFLKVPPEDSKKEENGSFQCSCKFAPSMRLSKIKTKCIKKKMVLQRRTASCSNADF